MSESAKHPVTLIKERIAFLEARKTRAKEAKKCADMPPAAEGISPPKKQSRKDLYNQLDLASSSSTTTLDIDGIWYTICPMGTGGHLARYYLTDKMLEIELEEDDILDAIKSLRLKLAWLSKKLTGKKQSLKDLKNTLMLARVLKANIDYKNKLFKILPYTFKTEKGNRKYVELVVIKGKLICPTNNTHLHIQRNDPDKYDNINEPTDAWYNYECRRQVNKNTFPMTFKYHAPINLSLLDISVETTFEDRWNIGENVRCGSYVVTNKGSNVTCSHSEYGENEIDAALKVLESINRTYHNNKFKMSIAELCDIFNNGLVRYIESTGKNCK